MLDHVSADAIRIAKPTNVRKLHELVRADALHVEGLAEVSDVGRTGDDTGNAAAREGHLARRGKLIDEVIVVLRSDRAEDVEQVVRILVEIVNRVGVVPEDAEVRCGGPEGGEAANDFIRVSDARGVRVLGNAPDALDRRIVLDEAHDLVHVGALRRHANGHVRVAHGGADCEVAIIAGRRAQELERAAGGLNRMGLAAANAVDPAMDDDVVHDVQARRSTEDEIVRVDAKKICHETASRW